MSTKRNNYLERERDSRRLFLQVDLFFSSSKNRLFPGKKMISVLLFLCLVSCAVAQPDVVSAVTVSDESRLATAVFFLFAAAVLAGTYTTHHWEKESRSKITKAYLPFAGDGSWSFVWAKAVWFGVYALLILGMWFTWFTAGQESIKWWWTWVLLGVLLLFDKLWAYLYFYETRFAAFGLILGFLVGALAWAVFGLLIAQFILHAADIVGAGSSPTNLIVAIVLMGVFALIYWMVIVYNAWSTYRPTRVTYSSGQAFYPQNFVQPGFQPQGYPGGYKMH